MNLVVGFNPSEKYDRQIWWFPQIFGLKIPKIFELPPPKNEGFPKKMPPQRTAVLENTLAVAPSRPPHEQIEARHHIKWKHHLHQFPESCKSPPACSWWLAEIVETTHFLGVPRNSWNLKHPRNYLKSQEILGFFSTLSLLVFDVFLNFPRLNSRSLTNDPADKKNGAKEPRVGTNRSSDQQWWPISTCPLEERRRSRTCRMKPRKHLSV